MILSSHCQSGELATFLTGWLSVLILVHLERGNESLLWNLDLAELAHLLLAFLLLVEKLALARDVAAIAFGGHVLAQSGKRFARDDLAADCRLDRDLEHVARDELLELLAHHPAALFGAA